MNTTIKLPVIGIAGLVTTGLLALPIAAFAADGDPAMKRDDASGRDPRPRWVSCSARPGSARGRG